MTEENEEDDLFFRCKDSLEDYQSQTGEHVGVTLIREVVNHMGRESSSAVKKLVVNRLLHVFKHG